MSASVQRACSLKKCRAGEVALHQLRCDSWEAECEAKQATVTLGRFKSSLQRQLQVFFPLGCLSCKAASVKPLEQLAENCNQATRTEDTSVCTCRFFSSDQNKEHPCHAAKFVMQL